MATEYPNRIVWAEIPVTDLKRATAFYETILNASLKEDNTGPNPMAMLPYPGGAGASGHLYPGTPAKNGQGITAHLAVSDDLDSVMTRVKNGGGEVVSDIITIPAGSFFYAIDTEGNSVGFFKV